MAISIRARRLSGRLYFAKRGAQTSLVPLKIVFSSTLDDRCSVARMSSGCRIEQQNQGFAFYGIEKIHSLQVTTPEPATKIVSLKHAMEALTYHALFA